MFAKLAFAIAMLGVTPALAADFAVTAPGIAKGFTAQNVQAASYGLGCDGKNLSPGLAWSNPPAGTKSFLVSLYDRDAPTGSGFWHWVVANVPADATSLAEGAGSGQAALPAGAIVTRSDMGVPGYIGPCPPQGSTHTYVLSVTALKVPALQLDANSTPEIAGFMASGITLGRATLEITYSR